MHKNLLLLFLYAPFIHCDAQSNTKVNAATLIKITQESDYRAFVQLTKDVSYKVFDSTKDKDGSIFYFTREVKLNGNTLACGTDAKLKIKQLTFDTYDKATYSNLKKQIAEAGLKSSSHSTGGFPEIAEAEDFEGKGILASSAARKNDDGTTHYEFTFFKFP